jgi:type IV secretory pathway VirJ component
VQRIGRKRSAWIVLVFLIPAIYSCAAVAPSRDLAETFNYDRFGTVRIYRGRGRLHDAVLLLSGDAGWDATAAALAHHLADKGSLVAGIDLRHYREALEQAAEACVSPASDLENLSHYLQSKLQVKTYLVPVLVGYRSGATLAHATLVEAPDGLFKGALGIGPATDLGLKKSVCGNLSASADLRKNWIVLEEDRGATTGHAPGAYGAGAEGAAVDAAAVDAALTRLAAAHDEIKPAALPAALADLPLILVPSRTGESEQEGGHADGDRWFGVFLTGDGGWVGLDKGVSTELAKHDIPIIGWDSLKYFWKRRTPEGAARDLDRVLRYYSKVWGRTHVLLIGYSQGADTMPFMINRLPAATHTLVGYTVLLGISDNALWEFHVATWLGSPAKGIPTAPELDHWSGAPYLCIYGESDADAACAQETGHDGTALKMTGGHHFGGGYDKIADEILSRLPRTASPDSATPTPD